MNSGSWIRAEDKERPHAFAATNKAYAKARDALIPQAEKLADRDAERSQMSKWSRAFHSHMDRLAKEAGL